MSVLGASAFRRGSGSFGKCRNTTNTYATRSYFLSIYSALGRKFNIPVICSPPPQKKNCNWQQFLPSMKYSTPFLGGITRKFGDFSFYVLFKMTTITKTFGYHQERHLLRVGQPWQAENYHMTHNHISLGSKMHAVHHTVSYTYTSTKHQGHTMGGCSLPAPTPFSNQNLKKNNKFCTQ